MWTPHIRCRVGDMRMCDHMWFFCLKPLIKLFFVISYFDSFITWMWSVWCVSERADCPHRNIVSMLRAPYVKCGCCWQCLCTYSWKRAVCLCDGSRYPVHGCKLRPRWSLGKRSYYTNASFSWKRNQYLSRRLKEEGDYLPPYRMEHKRVHPCEEPKKTGNGFNHNYSEAMMRSLSAVGTIVCSPRIMCHVLSDTSSPCRCPQRSCLHVLLVGSWS